MGYHWNHRNAQTRQKSIEQQRKLILYHFENDKKQGGVGFSNYKCGANNYMESFISNLDCVAAVVIRISKRYKIEITQVYAPTHEELDSFYGDFYRQLTSGFL